MRQKWMEFLIGVFVVAAVVLLLGLIVTMGSSLFGDRYKVTAYFQNVAGLSRNVSVRMAGFTIGEVTRIRFMTPEESQRIAREGVWVKVVMSIDDRYPIATDAELHLNPQLVLGEVYLDVTTGKSTQYLPRDGTAVIQKAEMGKTEVQRVIEETSQKLAGIEGRLNDFLDNMNNTLTFINQKDMQAELRATVSNVRNFSERALSAVDTFDRFLGETRAMVATGEQTLAQMTNLAVSADATFTGFGRSAEEIQQKVTQGIDMFHTTTGDLRQAAWDLTDLLGSLNRAVQKREGTIGLLVKTTELHDRARDTLMRLEATAASVQRAAIQTGAAAEQLNQRPGSLIWGRGDRPEPASAGGQTIGANDIGLD